jgi:hypothetical protein
MGMDGRTDQEYAGLLQRDAAGFLLQCDDGQHYRLELLRVPVDEVAKRVVVTGQIRDGAVLEADGIRLA